MDSTNKSLRGQLTEHSKNVNLKVLLADIQQNSKKIYILGCSAFYALLEKHSVDHSKTTFSVFCWQKIQHVIEQSTGQNIRKTLYTVPCWKNIQQSISRAAGKNALEVYLKSIWQKILKTQKNQQNIGQSI